MKDRKFYIMGGRDILHNTFFLKKEPVLRKDDFLKKEPVLRKDER